MNEKIKELVDFEIISIQFVERDGLKFLDIELPDKDLKTIEEKSKIISQILDQIEYKESNYYLNVFSSGTEKEIKLENIGLYLTSNIYIELSKHYLNKDKWEGQLIENNNDNIVLIVNNKGKFQKLKIEKPSISFIKTTAKLRKEK